MSDHDAYPGTSQMPVGELQSADIAALIAAGHEAKDYRPVAVAVIANAEDQVLLVQSAKDSSEWGYPQGGIDAGEGLKEALLREVHEETGIAEDELEVGALSEIIDLDAPADRVDKRGFTKGKRYFVLHARYSGDGELSPDPDEVSAYVWATPDQVQDYIENKRAEKRDLMIRALSFQR